MNDDPVFNRLRELNWRRPLTESEQAELRAWFATHPEAREGWEAEANLTEWFARLPDAPVPSNFTARVLQAIEREAAQARRIRAEDWSWWWRVLVPRAAIAAVVATTCSFTYHRHLFAQRAELAESVAAVAEVRSLSSPKMLEDFEAIRRLSQTPPPDNALLALLK